ncbi:phage major tail protein, TP901-1 family [Terribacillus sp. 179-K 1B1 HS]|uniref:phage major tail protein, TP901-1 family n=1 Tax=Terribacillus sp. 179-K 1B1 HS TaxID=3142388 RepID=UPI0039A21FBF
MAAPEYSGEEILYLVGIEDETTGTVTDVRAFNQTDGSTSISADSIDLDTKDKSGSSYGRVSQTVSMEGVLTQDDPAIDFLKRAIRRKKFVRITEVNTRTLKTETGLYMLSTFELTYPNSDNATYSLEGSLSGEVTEGTLTEVPEGAPDEVSEAPAEPTEPTV